MEVVVKVKCENIIEDRLIYLKSWRALSVSGDQIEGKEMCEYAQITEHMENLCFNLSDEEDRRKVVKYLYDTGALA